MPVQNLADLRGGVQGGEQLDFRRSARGQRRDPRGGRLLLLGQARQTWSSRSSAAVRRVMRRQAPRGLSSIATSYSSCVMRCRSTPVTAAILRMDISWQARR